ncbi:MAG: EMC3/TMCO1 family protein [Nanobdellota archaeon]
MTEETSLKENKSGKEGSFTLLIVFMILASIIAALWDKIPAVKNAIHYVLDPSAGALLNWNLTLGMLIIVFILTALSTLVQKYATDQKALRDIRKEQKELQKEMNEAKNNPQKLMEIQKKQFAMFPKQMKLSMRSVVYTGIPFILLFRWFQDYFNVLALAQEAPVRFFGFMGWFLFYFVFTMLFSSLLRKWWDVA